MKHNSFSEQRLAWPQIFWVTETVPIQEAEKVGVAVRGNLRKDRDEVLAHVCAKTEELFGE